MEPIILKAGDKFDFFEKLAPKVMSQADYILEITEVIGDASFCTIIPPNTTECVAVMPDALKFKRTLKNFNYYITTVKGCTIKFKISQLGKEIS